MSRVTSVERAIALLGGVASRPAGLVELAQAADLPTSTAARLLATLEGVDAVRRNATGVYRIGPTIASLAAAAELDTGLTQMARPHMVQLVAEIDEAIGLAIPAGRDSVTILQLDAPRPIRAEDWTGTRWPLHAGCSGIVLLSRWPDDEVDDYLAGPLVQLTDATEVDPSRVRDRIARTRTAGLDWSHGEYVEGLSSVAVPILDGSGRAIATLYAYGPSYRFPDASTRDPVEHGLQVRAQRISESWTARVGGA